MRPAATNTRRKSVHERPDLDGNWLREAYSWIVESDGQSRHPWELIARREGLTTHDGDAGRWEQAWAQQLETSHGIRAQAAQLRVEAAAMRAEARNSRAKVRAALVACDRGDGAFRRGYRRLLLSKLVAHIVL